MDAFDSDVLIYAAAPGHELGRRVLPLFDDVTPDAASVGVGSLILVPEVLAKPMRMGALDEVADLTSLLGRIELRPVDDATAQLALALGVSYGLRAPDAIHLATAVAAGADRFITNNRRDFPQTITEVDVTYPEDLAEPG